MRQVLKQLGGPAARGAGVRLVGQQAQVAAPDFGHNAAVRHQLGPADEGEPGAFGRHYALYVKQ